jgi:hypothetical protein
MVHVPEHCIAETATSFAIQQMLDVAITTKATELSWVRQEHAVYCIELLTRKNTR